MAYPLLENVDEELAVLLTGHRTLCDQVAGLRVEHAFAAGLFAPALVGDLDSFFGGALDHRDELHPLCTQLIAEETVDRAAVFLVRGVDRAEDIEFDFVPAQRTPSVHDFVKGALAAAVDTIRIVDFARAVDAESDQEVVLPEEGAPAVIEKNPVGLKCMLHRLAALAILFDQFDGAPEELQLHQRRLPALPG